MIIILAGTFVAFGLFYYLDQKRKIRNRHRQDRKREKFEQIKPSKTFQSRQQNKEVKD